MSFAEMNARLESVAYARDTRNRKAPDFTFRMPDEPQEDGSILEGLTIELPTHKEVCPVCRGEGTTVNPSIDCNGLSHEDFADDPDFAEDYTGGVYDVECGHCEGLRVVKAVDWDQVPADVRAAYERRRAEEQRDFEEHLAELRAGC